LLADELERVERRHENVTTVYCHVLDFARNNGTWTPPR